MNGENESGGRIDRRALLRGGAAALAAGSFLAVAPAAVATAATGGSAPQGDGSSGPVPRGQAIPETSPITTTIASAPISGYTYRVVTMYDFFPFNPAAGKTWGGNGVYSSGVGTTLRATMEIPPGALIKDVEYYIFNNSGSDFIPDSHIYVPGFGSISSIGASVVVPSNAGAVSASRAIVSQQGPYPFGSRLLVSCSTPSTGTIQVNGARVGFVQGGAASGLFSTPIRVYDSRGGAGKLAPGVTRTITLPANLVLPGTTGVIANITVANGAAIGYVRIWPASGAEPVASAINFGPSTPVANAMIIAVSSGRQINVEASVPVDVIIDLTGIIA
jgi:hypothetical protein